MVLKRKGLRDTKRWADIPAYATFLNAGTNNDGYTPQGIMFPSSEMQRKLEEQVELCGLRKRFLYLVGLAKSYCIFTIYSPIRLQIRRHKGPSSR